MSTDETTSSGATTTPAPNTGRGRLWASLRRPPSRGQIVAAVLLAVLGFAAAVQVRSNQDSNLEGLRQSDLVRILDDVSDRTARLQAEARDLQNTRDQITGGASGSRGALQDARDRSRTLGILAGTLPATGPGLELTITDPQGKVSADVLLDCLQELRNAGAEAVTIESVGGPTVRVGASTYLQDTDKTGSGSAVVVDGTRLESPFRFTVIGDPDTMAAALDIPGGVLDVLRQRGADGMVTEHDRLTISSLRPTPTPQYARPAQDTGSG